jgi:hypothetical protein
MAGPPSGKMGMLKICPLSPLNGRLRDESFMKKSSKKFDSTFLARLDLMMQFVERERAEFDDLVLLDEEYYDAILSAYEDAGGDSVTARREIALAKESRDQALSRVLQYISNKYLFGPIECLGHKKFTVIAFDAFDAIQYWIEEVEMDGSSETKKGPFQVLLKEHYRLNEAMLDRRDLILWPVAKRIIDKRGEIPED